MRDGYHAVVLNVALMQNLKRHICIITRFNGFACSSNNCSFFPEGAETKTSLVQVFEFVFISCVYCRQHLNWHISGLYFGMLKLCRTIWWTTGTHCFVRIFCVTFTCDSGKYFFWLHKHWNQLVNHIVWLNDILLSSFHVGKYNTIVTQCKNFTCSLKREKNETSINEVVFHWSQTVLNVKVTDCYLMENLEVLFFLKPWCPSHTPHFTTTIEKTRVDLRDNRRWANLAPAGVQKEKTGRTRPAVITSELCAIFDMLQHKLITIV